MSKLKWDKLTRFGTDTHYYSGVYKISSYKWFKNREVKRYFQVYILLSTNWGDYVSAVQHDKMLTLNECKKIAQDHYNKYGEPHPSRIKVAQAAIARSMAPHIEWQEKQNESL